MAQTLRNTITYFQQSSFAAGELSPDMYGRVDFNKYDVGLSDCTNMYPLPFGGVVSRPGTEYIYTLADSDKKVQLIPFQVSTKVSYVLVFVSDGNLYFLTDRGILLDNNKAPYHIGHNFTSDEIGSIKYAQSADVIFLTVSTHKPMKLSRYGVNDWRLEEFITDGGPFMAINDSDISLSYSSGKLTASGKLFTSNDVGRWMRLDEAVAAHSDSFTATDGALTYMGQPQPCKGNWSLIMSASFDGEFGLEVSHDGKATWENLQKWKTKDVGTLQDSGEEKELCWIRLTAKANTKGGIVQLNVDSFVNTAYVKISKYISPTEVNVEFKTSINEKNFGVIEAFKNQYYYAFDSWNSVNGYPRSVAFYQDRLCFASTSKEPLGVWLSAVGDYYNFKTTIAGEDDESINVNLVSQSLNVSNSLVSKNDLLSFTPGGTWRINSRNQAQGLTAATISASQQSFEGANTLQPLIINDRVLYVLELGATVRDISYDYTVDSYKGDDLTLLSRHLFRDNSIVSWCYAQEPDSLIWAVRDDGILLTLTYVKEQNVYAWAKHTTNGKFKAVQSISGNGVTDVYVIVERNGKLYVEIVSKRYDAIKDSTTINYMDCSAVYDGTDKVTEITGLEFLEGMQVQIFADGSIYPEQIVKDGKIKLQSPAKYVRVGLGYTKTMATMNLDVQRQDGTSQGRKKRASVIKVLLNNSYGGKIETTGLTRAVRIDGMKLPVRYGEPINLQSGLFITSVNAPQNENLYVKLTQQDPLPMNVLAIMADVEYGNT